MSVPPVVSTMLYCSAFALPTASVPAVTKVSPANVLTPLSVSVPVPLLVRPPDTFCCRFTVKLLAGVAGLPPVGVTVSTSETR